MNAKLGTSTLLLILFCIVIETARELCFKRAAMKRSGYLSPMVITGITLWAIELVVWTIVLEQAPLTIAFPLMSICYALIPLGGAWLFHERLKPRQWLGTACITFGVACIGATGI